MKHCLSPKRALGLLLFLPELRGTNQYHSKFLVQNSIIYSIIVMSLQVLFVWQDTPLLEKASELKLKRGDEVVGARKGASKAMPRIGAEYRVFLGKKSCSVHGLGNRRQVSSQISKMEI
eukprot:1211146-Rhodomonas_salina.2